ncbi:discoidin domain-containing protein [Flavivirga aquatica]|nr:discoidin domain-containing protein [Flavivirga aquatica]
MFLICTGLLSAQNTNIALGKPTLADSVLDSNTSSKAVDGDNQNVHNRWVSANTSWPHWIEVDLQEDFEIEQLKFWTGSGGYNRAVRYEFQIWNGSTWVTIVDGNSNSLAIVDKSFSKVTTSKVRLYGIGESIGGGAGNYFRLYELEVYGIPKNTGNGSESSSLWTAIGNDINYIDGNVGIGTETPDAELTVKGKIHTKEVKVDLEGAVAPDYVFYDDYKLRTLKEVQHYIDKYGHLPNIPSAKQMQQEGIRLKEMNLKLLEKIEELTLYILTQNKKQMQLEKRIEQLESQN